MGGIPWGKDAPRLPQATLKLTREEATELHNLDRLKRLNQDAVQGVRLQLLERGVGEPYLLITGTNTDGVEAAKKAALLMLQHDGGLVIPMHAHDINLLRSKGCFLMAEVEEQSGCRIIADDKQDEAASDKDLNRKQPCVHLLGNQASQTRAIELLAKHCTRLVSSDEPGKLGGSSRTRPLECFDPVLRGHNIELSDDRMVARRQNTAAEGGTDGCVVVGAGALATFALGAFCCFKVRKTDPDRRCRGGMRLALSDVVIKAPVPRSILPMRGTHCWILGQGCAWGHNGEPHELPSLNLDGISEGDEIGILVTKEKGGILVCKRAAGDDEWRTVVNWGAAEVPAESRSQLIALVELSGRILEVELVLNQQPPVAVRRALDN